MKKILSIAILLFSTSLFGADRTEYEDLKLFNDVLSQIRTNYVEEKKTSDLIDGAINGMVHTLDPFSQYLRPESAKLLKSETKGEFGGLGIRITIKDKILTVITPLPGTPAFKMGILPGDKIIKIEGTSTEGISLMEAVKKLRGKPGTKVTITIARDKETKDITITRGIIKIESVPKDQATLLDYGIGYIKITEFSITTAADFRREYNLLESEGMKALILDLRNNPGGLLQSAVDIAKQFLAKDQLVVYTKGRRQNSNFKFYADKDYHTKIPLVVLVNHGSASGSEIVAGAIKDWKRGILLGEKTFGKGSVQSLINLSDGSELRLTTAKYYTPSGVCIHEKGIKPDIEVKIPIKDQIKLMQQSEKIYGLSPEELKKREKDKIKDAQLERAKQILFAELMFSGKIEENKSPK
ncbi:MAG: S41 family peptidase [Elusimicrobia bacterium]|nr:S41 family peptidase [Elusimicrobiota bacterium]